MSLAVPPPTTQTPELISDMLQEYGAMTHEAIKQYLPSGVPRQHLYDLLSDYPERGGKMMRSTICLASARAFGSRLEDALLSAVAIELLHNALLIHDDIEDGSEERRGRPTLHKLHGIPLALNAGDTLSLLSLRPLMDNIQRIGPGLAMRIFKETERVAWESAEGQAMELGWCRDNCNDLNLLAGDDPPDQDRRIDWNPWKNRPRPLHSLRLLCRGCLPDPGRPVESGCRRSIRKGTEWRYLGRETNTYAYSHLPKGQHEGTAETRGDHGAFPGSTNRGTGCLDSPVDGQVRRSGARTPDCARAGWGCVKGICLHL